LNIASVDAFLVSDEATLKAHSSNLSLVHGTRSTLEAYCRQVKANTLIVIHYNTALVKVQNTAGLISSGYDVYST